MKHTIMTPKDAIIVPAGFTAPMWVAEATTWLGLLIAVLTSIYFIFKVIDAWYQWQHRWELRKQQNKKGLKDDKFK